LIVNFWIIVGPLIIAITYPNVGVLAGLLGSFSGFLIVYFLPLTVFVKSMHTQVQHPLLAEALENRDYSLSELNHTNASGVSPYLKIRELHKGLNESYVSDFVKNNVDERQGNYYKSLVFAVLLFAFGGFMMCS
jgi:hypothetical protein